MRRDIDQDMERPAEHLIERLPPDEPDDSEDNRKDDEAVRPVIHGVDIGRDHLFGWVTRRPIRPLGDTEEVHRKEEAKRKEVRRDTKKEREPVAESAAPSKEGTTIESVRENIHTRFNFLWDA